jgi:hypothetical protein
LRGIALQFAADRDEFLVGELQEAGEALKAAAHDGGYGGGRFVAEIVLDLRPGVLKHGAYLDLAAR